MEKNKLNHLIEILSIPTYFGMETLIQEYLINYGTEKGYIVNKDVKGNIYFTKGKIGVNQYFPFVCAHIDSVFDEHKDLITQNKRKNIKRGSGKHNTQKLMAFHPDTNKRTGIAGDDLAGVFICLQMLEHFDNIKAAFFVEEEYGCKGSNNCDETFFKNVGYAIQFDGPTGNWFTYTLGGIKMYDTLFKDTVKPILEKFNITNYSDDPYTDILPLKEKFDFCCCNLPTGYHNWHSNEEYVNIDQVEKGIEIGIEFINKLGMNKHTYNKIEWDSLYALRYDDSRIYCTECGAEYDENFNCKFCGHDLLGGDLTQPKN